jgi:hypothetical protein
MKLKLGLLALAGILLFASCRTSSTASGQPDKKLYVFLCLGQSNMEGFPGIEPQDTNAVDERFQVLACVDFPKMGRKTGDWYPAVPPLCRPGSGISPADYFGRTLVSNLPPNVRVGIVNVSVAGAKIEIFGKDTLDSYMATAPGWMSNIVKQYNGDPYARLVEMAKLAQKDGVIKGILLHQGESNSGDKEWPKKVKAIYDRLIADLNLKPEETPLLVGELVNADQKGACAGMNAIIDTLPKTIPNSHVISSKGCTSRQDHLHFDPAGYRELGKRYAEKMLPLLDRKVTAP